MTRFFYSTYDSPVGKLVLAGTAEHLHMLRFPGHTKGKGPAPHWLFADAPFKAATEQLKAYFNGELTQFTLPFKLSGTPFQIQVWHYLANIPFGETRTYAQMAQDLGRPKAARAVGAANACNPISIILPCHRVIGARGSLTGFAGGLSVKHALLEHEGALQ